MISFFEAMLMQNQGLLSNLHSFSSKHVVIVLAKNNLTLFSLIHVDYFP